MKTPCIFGEVLFDHFPDGSRVLGGAPFNVAWHLQAFRLKPSFISRVGEDAEGMEVRALMERWGMDTGHLQTDSRRPTGKVNVQFVGGEPRYDIQQDCAYDAIEEPAINSCDLLYHGSLALRSPTSAAALDALRGRLSSTVFIDVNLRSPWWHEEQVQDLLYTADWAKLNQEELALLSQSTTGCRNCADFLKRFQLHGVIVTGGADGAELVTVEGQHYKVKPVASGNVVDTVGAGDAFTAVMILGLLHHSPLETTLRRAQDFASELVSRRGATVQDRGMYRGFIEQWGLSVQ